MNEAFQKISVCVIVTLPLTVPISTLLYRDFYASAENKKLAQADITMPISTYSNEKNRECKIKLNNN